MIWDAVSRRFPTTAMLSMVGGCSVLGRAAPPVPPARRATAAAMERETLHPHSVGGGRAGSGGAGAERP